VSYDADNRKTSQTDGTGTTSYGYDTVGRLTSRNNPQGNVSYAYDAAGRKTSQTVGTATTTYSYDNAGRLLSAVAPNGTTQNHAYDTVTGDLLQLWHKNSGGGTIVQYAYSYDDLGRKVGEVQWGGAFAGSMVAYDYDDAGQLIEETHTGANFFTATYTYDNAGNRLTKTVGGVTEAYSYDAANKLLSVTGANAKTYSYDAAGNVTSVTSSAGTTNLTWDGAGRLTGATNGTLSNSFSYNGLGQRTGKTDSHGTFSSVLADDAIDSEVLSDGQATYQYAIGLVSEVRGGTSKVIHADSLGTTRTLTDASQVVTDKLETDAFGNVVTTAGNGVLGARPFGFAGQHGYQTDTDTGLMRLGHRYYDASTGRFISRDPIRAGYNWYAYCENDPVNAVDPEGLQGTNPPKGRPSKPKVPPKPKRPDPTKPPWDQEYSSEAGAAKAALVWIVTHPRDYPGVNVPKDEGGVEYGGAIHDLGDGLFQPAEPQIGNRRGVVITRPPGTDATYHTHPIGDFSNYFSGFPLGDPTMKPGPGDKDIARDFKERQYIIGSSLIMFYDPENQVKFPDGRPIGRAPNRPR
jgi:RHS repeat-associated protein